MNVLPRTSRSTSNRAPAVRSRNATSRQSNRLNRFKCNQESCSAGLTSLSRRQDIRERLHGLDSPHGTLDLQHQRHPGRLR